MLLSYAVVRRPVHPRGAPSASPHKSRGLERLAASKRMALRAREPRHAAMGKSVTKAKQAVAEECGALRHRCLER